MSDDRYADIIDLPHHVSVTRRHMSIKDRAAQFSAFAALTGYSDEIKETARLTDDKREMDETELEELSLKLALILARADEKPYITVTYFSSDQKKSGGVYKTVTGNLKKVDEIERTLTLTDGDIIRLDDIIDIESGNAGI
ncbi:MAG: YolD-like family protein [Lachnospiraceae bacterium]|nr:YolD-like family protein [Lachnospiraceae bacterium]